jgi:TRAP-type C4-dicarboxylate transport system substrate-binding protein
MESSPTVNNRQISRVLAGTDSYDSLAEREQAIVREKWAERTRTLRNELNYETTFASAGEEYSELDDEGNLVVHRPAT